METFGFSDEQVAEAAQMLRDVGVPQEDIDSGALQGVLTLAAS
jgi:hypothetical protein